MQPNQMKEKRTMKLCLVTLLLFTACLHAQQTYTDFFTADEVSIMQQSEELLGTYKQVGFTIHQIIDENTLLVQSGDFSYVFKINTAGLSDGSIITGLARSDGTYTFTTVLGTRRTLEQFVSISEDDLNIIQQSVPLFERRELVEAELEREKAALNYLDNKEAMLHVETLAKAFLEYSDETNNEHVLEFRNKLVGLINEFQTSHRSGEYWGGPLDGNYVESISNDMSLLKLMVDREKDAAASQREQELRDREDRRLAAQRRIQEEAQQRIDDFAEISKIFTMINIIHEYEPYNIGNSHQRFERLAELGYTRLEINRLGDYNGRVNNAVFNARQGAQSMPSNMDEYLNSNFRLIQLSDLKEIIGRVQELDPDSYYKAEFMIEGKPTLFFAE
jgi:hypothetical protein